MFGGVKKKVAKAKDKKLKDKVGKAREEKRRKTITVASSANISDGRLK